MNTKKRGGEPPLSAPTATRVACPKVSLVLRRNAHPWGAHCDDKGHATWGLYGYECFGLLFDTIFVVVPSFETMPENNDSWVGPTLTTLYGAGHAAMVGGFAWPHLNTAGKISKVFMLIPECTKLVRTAPAPLAAAAKVVIGFIDGICISGSAIAGAVAAFTSEFEAAPAGMLYPPGAVRLAD
jgi:hypothetical protein